MKNDRHAEILRLIQNEIIETQADLADRLNKAGFSVTQATVSRDIRTLKLTKMPLEDGRTHYVCHSTGTAAPKYVRVIREDVVKMQAASNLLVIKTVSGMAMAAAAALDEWGNENLIGCVAGDDTVLCACPDAAAATALMSDIDELRLKHV